MNERGWGIGGVRGKRSVGEVEGVGETRSSVACQVD